MTTYNRILDDGRRDQGFRSQAHLDAFFVAFDHAQACPVCSGVAGSVELSDGMQPVMSRCAEACRLDRLTQAQS